MEMIECLLCARTEEGAAGKGTMSPDACCLAAPVCLQAVSWSSGRCLSWLRFGGLEDLLVGDRQWEQRHGGWSVLWLLSSEVTRVGGRGESLGNQLGQRGFFPVGREE